nr:MAG TPA: tail protein [Caudoviricetes sp.]
MEVHNNFSPLAFRKKESKATYEKWYAFGKNYAIPASANTLTPFQFTELIIPVFDPDTIEVEAVNEETGEATKTGVYVSFDVMPEHGGVLYVSPGKNSFREALPQGTYRARFSIGDEVYISTPFCVIPGIETSSKYLLIEYWNDEKIAYPDGFITTGANNDFRYQMYVPATICKPKYEFEEELTKRAGYKFLELQTSTKVYAFTFVAPEFICDAMRLIRLSDYIRISHDGEYYNALNFEFDVDWQEQLYLAAVDCQFETDSIIQKLPSFNRRDKASFYNALLANIDTPIMFSPDTVGLYYKEYRETESVIKGKLIRELSPIDLIDENTTIAVDMGAGEARKFNLYRMLEGYISKNHEDVTGFLLSLRGGVNIGTPNASGEYPASVDRDGNAKLKDIQGNDATLNNVTGKGATFKTVETGSLTVNKTSATIDGMGNANVSDLTARGDSMLRSDVYTGLKNGSHTGKITKEGQLQYLSAIIYEFLSSETFVPGLLGEGFKIWLENGNWHIECDNLTVRQTMNIFELLIQKIRSVNGAIVVSQSNGKLSAVEEVGTQYKLTTGEEFPTFQEGDLVRCQTFAGYQGAGLTFDFTQFAKYDYSGGAFDSSLIDVTPDSISFNLNDTGNSGFAFYKFSESSPTPIEIPSFTLTLEGGYPGMLAFAAGLDSNDSPVEGVGVLLQNGDNVIPAIKAAQGVHNFAITITGDSGHGDGKVTVKQKKAAGSAPNNSLVKFYWVEVKAVDGASFFADKAEFNGVVPAVGDEVVQMGNTKNPERQALIYITAQESGHPYIEILNGVKTKSLSGTNRTRLGDLSNIQDSAFPKGQQPSGSGLYCDNAFLRGIFLLRNGKSVEDEVNQAKQDAANAATEAERAQQTAQEAKDRLNKWADDGFISPAEKPALIDEGKRIQAEFLQIKNNADKYGVSVTEYTKAYEDYLNELRYHSAQQPEDIAVRPELAQSQTIYYDRRNGALNAIANAAKSYVDEADKKLKEYLDTEITAIPGKIELSVKTKVENLEIGANNLYSYTSSQLNPLEEAPSELNRRVDDHGFHMAGTLSGNSSIRIPNIIPPIPGKYTVSGWIRGVQGKKVGFTLDVCDSDKFRVLSTDDNQWSYFKHTFITTRNTEENKVIYNFVDLGDISFAQIYVKDFKVESGEIATAWSPNEADSVYFSKEYTTSQINIVEGKITSTVEKINTVDGRVTGLASRIEQTEKSITSVVGDISVINSTTNRHISKQIDLRGWDNNKFFPLVISIPAYHKTRVEISRPLNTEYGKPSYGTHNGGFSMNLTFEMSGSGWGSLPVVTNIFDYTKSWHSAGAKIVVDLGQITETSMCRMGIRGGSMYDVTVDDTIDPNVINVYQTDYYGAYNTSFPVRTDGTEPVRTYGYYTEIEQTQESIALTANKVDDQGRRLSAAELTLSSDHAKLSVVEQTANTANSTANNANNKADATNNGLVETGINITSRKIVLKSDNVLFQNNAGQQTAALNANGRLNTNVIEAGEVVANGFAAQRITTGNLTVTDGAVIGGMTIKGGVLTGKNINIQDGARIGSFIIKSGVLSAENTPAGIQMTLSNNVATFDSGGVRVENNSGGYALTTTGNGIVFLTGSNFWVQCEDVDFMGAQTWKAPGVFYACTILSNGAIGKTWGNPEFHITRVTRHSTGRYTVNTTGSNGDYFVMMTACDSKYWLSTTVEPYSEGQFTYKVFDVNRGMTDSEVIIYFCGMVR